MSSTAAVQTKDVAKGAGMAALSRLGTLIEIVSQPVFTWLYGLATYGIYTVLWAAVNIVENIVDLSMTQGLQREVPAAKSESDAHAAVRFALLVTVLPATLIALLISLCAAIIAPYLSAADADASILPTTIALFAWALPLWTLIEVATSAVRARRAFGPEIRLRIFWEQLLRLGFAVVLWATGMGPIGLALAHLLSLLVTAILSLRLLLRYYDRHILIAAPLDRNVRHNLLKSALGTLPPSITRRLFNDLPPVALNLLIPGAGGAQAAGLFGIARKIASVPLIVRQAFLYVLAPLSSAQSAQDRAMVAPLYHFSVRLSLVIAAPLSALMILIAPDILGLFVPGAMAALPLVIALLFARAGEAIVGPATPLVEMLGHRALPLLNSATGLALALGMALYLVPRSDALGGATGMGIAVALGVMWMAWIATLQLRISVGLSLIDAPFLKAAVVAACGIVTLVALSALLRAPADFADAQWWHGSIMLILFFPILWVVLRFGLPHGDRLALGGFAQKLRLI